MLTQIACPDCPRLAGVRVKSARVRLKSGLVRVSSALGRVTAGGRADPIEVKVEPRDRLCKLVVIVKVNYGGCF